MARSRRPFERLGEPADTDRRLEAGRIDLLDRWNPDKVGARGPGDPEVRRLVARVFLEIG